MEVQQCMELTSTNCSIGLIVKLVCSVKRIAFAHTWASKRHFGFILHYTLLISADPVVMAGGPHPIPSRTRSLSPLALMVLRLKARESKSLPGPQKSVSIMPLADTILSFTSKGHLAMACRDGLRSTRLLSGLSLEMAGRICISGPSALNAYTVDAGWSSPVARQAHNLKVTGSNPVPAPKYRKPVSSVRRVFLCLAFRAYKKARWQ